MPGSFLPAMQRNENHNVIVLKLCLHTFQDPPVGKQEAKKPTRYSKNPIGI